MASARTGDPDPRLNLSGMAWNWNYSLADQLLQIAQPFDVGDAPVARHAMAWKLGKVRPVGRGALDAVQPEPRSASQWVAAAVSPGLEYITESRG